MEITNGCYIKFKPEYADDVNEVFVVSQWDGHKGWAGDEYGFGYFFTSNQVIVIEEDEDD